MTDDLISHKTELFSKSKGVDLHKRNVHCVNMHSQSLLILNCLPILEMSLSCSLSDSMFEQSESTIVST